MTYTPIFNGEFPLEANSRWVAIRSFMNQWCMPEDCALIEPDGTTISGLLDIARETCADAPSYSITSWLSLLAQAESTGAIEIRDCPTFEPIEQNFEDGSVSNATVILISGENDVFWAVANENLTADDPPVEIFQKYDPSSPAFIGGYGSLSQFALRYLCLYNEHASVTQARVSRPAHRDAKQP